MSRRYCQPTGIGDPGKKREAVKVVKRFHVPILERDIDRTQVSSAKRFEFNFELTGAALSGGR